MRTVEVEGQAKLEGFVKWLPGFSSRKEFRGQPNATILTVCCNVHINTHTNTKRDNGSSYVTHAHTHASTYVHTHTHIYKTRTAFAAQCQSAAQQD